MQKNILYVSIVVNVLLLIGLAVHWKYLGIKYQLVQTPPLSCYQISAGYIMQHDDIFKRSELTKEQEAAKATPSDEQLKAFRQATFIQDTAEQIEKLCNQPIGDYTKPASAK